MAFFHAHPHAHAGQGFAPLFRMLEDFDRYSNPAGTTRNGRGQLQSFQPKFDVRETETTYELHGELAGIRRQDVSIEFTDADRLVVRGRVERAYAAGTPPAGLVEAGAEAGRITEVGEHGSPHRHKPTVEDEAEVEAAEKTGVEVAEPATKGQAADGPADTAKYWVSERSIGEFSRSFQFPQRVDQDGVSANLKDGILTVVVPKAKKHEARRINIA